MSNRLKEAEIFASGAPGYWQVFQAPDTRSIVPSSLVKKPAILGIASGIFGAGIAALFTLLFTHRSSRRSILECCAATQAPLIAHLPSLIEEEARPSIDHFWITHLGPRLSIPGQVLFWTPAIEPAAERRLWSMLASTAWNDTGKVIRIHDLTPDSLWDDSEIPEALEWGGLPSATDSSSPPPGDHFAATLYRAASLPHGDARDQLARINYWMSVVFGQKDSIRRATKFRTLSDAYLPPCNGTIAWTDRPTGPIRKAADVISCFLAERFS